MLSGTNSAGQKSRHEAGKDARHKAKREARHEAKHEAGHETKHKAGQEAGHEASLWKTLCHSTFPGPGREAPEEALRTFPGKPLDTSVGISPRGFRRALERASQR